MNIFENKNLCGEVLFSLPETIDFSLNLFFKFKTEELNIRTCSNVIRLFFYVHRKYHIEHAYLVCLHMFKTFLFYQGSMSEDK